MALFQDTGLSQIILQAGQMITQSLASANRQKLEREQFDQQRQLFEENAKLRESKLKLAEEKLQLEQTLGQLKIQKAQADATVATATVGDRISQEQTKASQGVLSLEKANQDLEFDDEMRPHKLAIATADAELKALELKAAKNLGGDPDSLKKQLDVISQRSLITGRILTTAEELASLHVKKPSTRNLILGGLGNELADKYGSREYGWFYNQRRVIEQALTENNAGDRRRMLSGAGLANADQAAKELQDINKVIAAYESEISSFTSKAVDVNTIQADLSAMAKDIALKSGTGAQPTTTSLNSSGPQRSAADVQMEKISKADPDTAAEEALKLAQDIQSKNGTGMGPAIANVINSLPDDQRRAAIVQKIMARFQTQGAGSK